MPCKAPVPCQFLLTFQVIDPDYRVSDFCELSETKYRDLTTHPWQAGDDRQAIITRHRTCGRLWEIHPVHGHRTEAGSGSRVFYASCLWQGFLPEGKSHLIFSLFCRFGYHTRALMEQGLRKPLSFNTLHATGGTVHMSPEPPCALRY